MSVSSRLLRTTSTPLFDGLAYHVTRPRRRMPEQNVQYLLLELSTIIGEALEYIPKPLRDKYDEAITSKLDQIFQALKADSGE